ncbi:nucleotide exchange factor GrpE [Candidatus Sumerlaeota bacterium]|nr:nucleotide exchange factor GrpE [Candidatus Sumerlaeota bacterium]
MAKGREDDPNTYDQVDIQFVGPERAAPETTSPPETDPEKDPVVLRERWLRTAAELDNVRKRTADQIRRETMLERKAMLQGFLEVADSLDQALAAHRGEENDWFRGTRAILQQMHEVLGRFGARPFDALGSPFDPERHEAAARVPPTRETPDGTVVEVLQTGYEFDDGTLLRPARVVVAQRD